MRGHEGVAQTVARLLREHAAVVLALLGAALVIRWFSPPGGVGDAAGLAALVLVGGFALAHPGTGARTAGSLLVLHTLLEEATLRLPASYAARLRVEAVNALIPPVALFLLVRAARRADVSAPGRPLDLAAPAIALLGSLTREGAVYLLYGRPGDAHTLAYVLRYDAAYVAWGLAALAVGVAYASGVTRSLRRGNRRPERSAVVAASLAFLLIALDAGSVVAAMALPGPPVIIGYHADRVKDVPPGAELVHLEAAWPAIEPREGEQDWDLLARELDAARDRGLDVYLLVSTYPPDWLVKKRPDAVMVDENGEPFTWLDEAPGTLRERVWDLSFAASDVVAAKRAFVAEAVARYGNHPAVRYVAVANEPAYPMDWNLFRWASFDPYTLDAFRRTLHREYDGDLDRLNLEAGTEFNTWAEVMPPSFPYGRLGDEWMRFREDLLIQYVQGLVDVAREKTDRPVTVKIMAHALTRFAEPQAGLSDRVYRAFADMSDVVSVDLYPATRADLVRSVRYFDGIAEGKPVIVSEFNLAFGASLPGAGARTLGALHAMAPHVQGVILFTASGHYLYGVPEDSPTRAGALLFEKRPGDPDYPEVLGRFVAAEGESVAAIPKALVRGMAAVLTAAAR